jgi:hypothetical protein
MQAKKKPLMGNSVDGNGVGGLKLLRSLDDLKEQAAVPTWKRPNPKQRKKLKAKRAREGDE